MTNVVITDSKRITIFLVWFSQICFNENSVLLAYLATSGLMPGRLYQSNSSDELFLTKS